MGHKTQQNRPPKALTRQPLNANHRVFKLILKDIGKALIFLFLLLYGLLSAAYAQTTISPLRASLDAQSPEAIFHITNPATHSVKVHLEWRDLIALENGGYRPASIEERDHISAAPFLQLSPASFTLPPGGKQQVKVTLREPKQLAQFDHELRSHLLVVSAPDKGLRQKIGGLPLDMAVAVSVPVVLKPDLPASTASIDRVWLERHQDGGLILKLALQRHGKASIITGFSAALTKDFIAPEEIAIAHNIALYPEIEQRIVSLPLGTTALPSGEIELLLYDEGGSQPHLLARRIFYLAPPPGRAEPPRMIRVRAR